MNVIYGTPELSSACGSQPGAELTVYSLRPGASVVRFKAVSADQTG